MPPKTIGTKAAAKAAAKAPEPTASSETNSSSSDTVDIDSSNGSDSDYTPSIKASPPKRTRKPAAAKATKPKPKSTPKMPKSGKPKAPKKNTRTPRTPRVAKPSGTKRIPGERKARKPRRVPSPPGPSLLLQPNNIPELCNGLPASVRNPLEIALHGYHDFYSHKLFTDLLPYLLPSGKEVSKDELCSTRKGAVQNENLDMNLFLDVLPERGRDQIWLYTWRVHPHVGALRYSVGNDPRYYALPVSGTMIRKVKMEPEPPVGESVAAAATIAAGGGELDMEDELEDPHNSGSAEAQYQQESQRLRPTTGIPEPVIMGGHLGQSSAILETQWDETALQNLLIKLMGFRYSEPEFLPVILCCIQLSQEEAEAESRALAIEAAQRELELDLEDERQLHPSPTPRAPPAPKPFPPYPTKIIITSRPHVFRDPDSGALIHETIHQKWVPLPVCISPNPQLSWDERNSTFWRPPLRPSSSTTSAYTLPNISTITNTLSTHDLRCFHVVDATSTVYPVGHRTGEITPRFQLIIASRKPLRSRRDFRRWEWAEQELDELEAEVLRGCEDISTGNVPIPEEFGVGGRSIPREALTGNDILWTIRGVEATVGVRRGELEDLAMAVVHMVREVRGDVVQAPYVSPYWQPGDNVLWEDEDGDTTMDGCFQFPSSPLRDPAPACSGSVEPSDEDRYLAALLAGVDGDDDGDEEDAELEDIHGVAEILGLGYDPEDPFPEDRDMEGDGGLEQRLKEMTREEREILYCSGSIMGWQVENP